MDFLLANRDKGKVQVEWIIGMLIAFDITCGLNWKFCSEFLYLCQSQQMQFFFTANCLENEFLQFCITEDKNTFAEHR
jgi:hypothetical protein